MAWFCFAQGGMHRSTIESELNNEIISLRSWLGENRLFLNTAKTECMLIGTQTKVSKVINFNKMWNKILIKQVNQFTNLRITFDEHLLWNCIVTWCRIVQHCITTVFSQNYN